MATAFFPIIPPKDYETFRRILGDHIPATYAEWRDLVTDRGRQLIQEGGRARGVHVDPDEFMDWLAGRWEQCSAKGLDAFAAHTAAEVYRDQVSSRDPP